MAMSLRKHPGKPGIFFNFEEIPVPKPGKNYLKINNFSRSFRGNFEQTFCMGAKC
jgi:hypothetical protein